MKSPFYSLILELLSQSYLNNNHLTSLKRKWAKKFGFIPKNSQILAAYRQMVKKKIIPPSENLVQFLTIRKVRSLSGIVPVAVLTKPYPCPGNCVYCPTQKGMPKSYLKDEPAVMRAKAVNFDPYLQVKRRIDQLKKTGHSTQKIELIVMGGTFSSLPKKYQIDFISRCFLAANQSTNPSSSLNLKDLEKIQKENQKAANRIVGLTLETRPDQINIDQINLMRRLGATRIELGVQSIYPSVLKKIKRGHRIEHTIHATKLLKDAGFKINYHLMPNLPGSNPKKDLNMFKKIFTHSHFKPDMIKIYPCVVCYQAELYQWFKKGKFIPYSDSQLIDLLLEIKKIIPPWVRIMRLGRDIPAQNIAAGTKISNIRQVLTQEMKKRNIFCQCIRCREIKNNPFAKIKLEVFSYRASGGREYFLQYIDDKNRLYALLRLRIPSQFYTKKNHFLPILQDCALVREVHTYGFSAPLKIKSKKFIQHQGLGKKLIQKAEEITKSLGIKKIAVIAGVGTREYYQKLGYKLKETYMIKQILQE